MRILAVPILMALPIAALGADKAAPAAKPGAVERGKYLAWAVGCNDCHTPKKMGPAGPELDTTRLLAGHPEADKLPPPPAGQGPWIAVGTWDMTAWSGPWGISYSINLTPDDNTGIGSWSEETFVKAIKTGRHMGVSRPILPPMPWDTINKLNDEDLKAIYAYLKSIPPLKNRVPEPVPPPVPPPAPPDKK